MGINKFCSKFKIRRWTENHQEVGGTSGGGGSTSGDEGKEEADSAWNVLKEGDFVKLKCNVQGKDGEQEILCRVLYDKAYNETNDKDYGVQLVAVEGTEDVTLGFKDPRVASESGLGASSTSNDYSSDETDVKRAIWSYNHAMETLDKVAEKYTGTNIKYTRCFGSDPAGGIITAGESYATSFGAVQYHSELTYNTTTDASALLSSGDWGRYGSTTDYPPGWQYLPVKSCYYDGFYVLSWSPGRFDSGGYGYSFGIVIEDDASDAYSITNDFVPCFVIKSGAKISTDAGQDGNDEATAYTL